MKYTAVILFLLTVCVSCNSFQHMQYRKLKKVPADIFFVATVNRIVDNPGKTSVIQDSLVIDSSVVSQQQVDSAGHEEILTTENSEGASVTMTPSADVNEQPVIQAQSTGGADLHRDWSWLIAILMILGGLYLIAYIIFSIPGINIYLILQIVLSLFLLYAALKLIVTGIAILRNRVRQPKTYKES